jgi:hypothetical protein
MRSYYGPQYDIQTGHRHQGYGVSEDIYGGYHGAGSLYIPLPKVSMIIIHTCILLHTGTLSVLLPSVLRCVAVYSRALHCDVSLQLTRDAVACDVIKHRRVCTMLATTALLVCSSLTTLKYRYSSIRALHLRFTMLCMLSA